MKLHDVVPWGRNQDEYRRMFKLTDSDLRKRILGVGDGPASFNTEMTEAGYSVVSVDPMYAFSEKELEKRIDDTCATITEQMHKHADSYNWTTFEDVDHLSRERMRAMSRFLGDYEAGQQQGRYQLETLPELSFGDQAFDLALCSHLLFLYSDQLSESFHLESIHSLLRVAREVRIFPLITLNGQPSPYLLTILADCQAQQIQTEVISVNYHFQKGAYHMLRLTNLPKSFHV